MLQKEYPNENPSQCLRRLIKMWDLHTKSLALGMRCTPSCNCESGWIRVFHRGDENGASKRKQKQSGPEERNIIPRKRARLDVGDYHVTCAKATDEVATFSYKTSLPQRVFTEGSSTSARAPSPVDIAHMSSYKVDFDSTQPLGFYCETRGVAGKRVCVVTSVYNYGQCRQKSNLIQAGSWSKLESSINCSALTSVSLRLSPF